MSSQNKKIISMQFYFDTDINFDFIVIIKVDRKGDKVFLKILKSNEKINFTDQICSNSVEI